MGVTGQEDTAIADDVLKNTWALKGQSGNYFREAMATVTSFISRGHQIYPPDFPSFEFFDSHSISISPSGEFDGSITPTEAVAALILHNECSALTQLPRQDSFKIPAELAKIMQLPDQIDLGATINGIAQFGNRLGQVAWVRNQLLMGKDRPTERKAKYTMGRMWGFFEEPLIKDNMAIGNNTTQAIVDSIEAENRAERELTGGSDLAKTREQDSKVRGAQMARSLFLEASQLASNQLPK